MPVPGEQHRGIANPFEDDKRRVSEWTAKEIATLQSRLEKQLGPEYISSRKGPGNRTLYYLPAEKAINLANEVFGFNGWSSSIRDVQIDFVDQAQSSGKISLGLSVIIRVTLKDGTYHEDIGYGHIENCQGKAAAFEKAKKEAATDALKRALRTFGNVLGNCLYDKNYESKISKMKVAPTQWNPDKLHRHSDYAPAKQEGIKFVPQPAPDQRPPSIDQSAATKSMDAEDEFGGNLFDSMDFDHADADANSNDDSAYESMLMESANSKPETPALPAQHQQLTRFQSRPAMRPPSLSNGAQKPQPQPPQQYRPQASGNNVPSNANEAPRPEVSRVQTPNGQRQQQPSRPTAQRLQAAAAAAAQTRKTGSTPPIPQEAPNETTNPQLPARFVSGRAAELLQKATAASRVPPPIAPEFDPHLESPSLRRTVGFNHKTSAPVSRLAISGIANDTNVTTNGNGNGQGPPPPGGGGGRTNFNLNQADMQRRVGMPPPASSPLGMNRTSYKPPLKRPAEQQQSSRPPLADMSNMQADAHSPPADGVDGKRTRLSGSEAQ